ncbi:MAG: hypothetical protein ISR59_00230 [Anaerolineales bacterium]|uniref:Uncharacterized protein n=1 Tax=Candidatus Desulfolinea nitratireducens TaxID=2841698 RepID=A0A8J6NJW5_9CHLR|nr:hypothetical protein [Candidatus Desulfolinea nitratireducens]MBL6959505.1 hypothetical protein [Anaerolineales bacterium]
MAKKSNRKTNGRKPINSVRPSRTAAEFNPDYTEIKNDLKRIGLLAGMFLAVLIVLSFIL